MHGFVQVCEGVCGCDWVGVGGWYVVICAGVYRCVQGVCKCAQVCMGVLWYAQVCRGGPGCVWKCSGVWSVHGYGRVCVG